MAELSRPPATPLIFAHRRVSSIPAREEIKEDQPHAFNGNLCPRGSDTVQVLVDTSILIATGAAHNINGVARFDGRYAGRAFTTQAIRDEINHRALNANPNIPTLASAAKRARDYLVKSGRVQVQNTPQTREFFSKMQLIHTKLRELAKARQPSGVTSSEMQKHAGEATLIAIAGLYSNPVLLTNDGGASLAAAAEDPSIKSLHFGDVLKEFVCQSKGELSLDQAKLAFIAACEASGIPFEAKPEDEDDFFTCGLTAGAEACLFCT
ncbi:hypothetical protein [Dactylosporangium sp. NPDC006015]|uniref:hypothetical protein n=1 Tax=Dactylosporangium sp. NPDC006015 TaxID=3154576 RepID=UPI0033A978AA